MPRLRLLLCGSLLLVLCWLGNGHGLWASNGVEDIGVSLQSQGRGGADVAVGDSALSQIDNPATLILQGKFRFDYAGKLVLPRTHWEGPVGSSYSAIGVIPIVNAGLAFPINDDLAWGFGMHTRAGLACQFRNNHLLMPFGPTRDRANFEDVDLPVDLAVRLTDRLSLGIGGRFEMASVKFNTVFGPADFDFERGYAFGGGFQLGLHYQATPTLALGVGYRSPTWFGDLAGGDLRLTPLGLPGPTLNLGSAAIDSFHMPQRISAGAAWDMTDWLKLVGEVRWTNWYNSSLRTTTISTSTASYTFPLGYKDQTVLIAGAEVRLTDNWKVSTGYNYGTDPVDRYNLLPIGSVLTKHHVTTGVYYSRSNWWVGTGYVLGVTTAAEGTGTSAWGDYGDYGRSRISVTQHNVLLGFGFSR